MEKTGRSKIREALQRSHDTLRGFFSSYSELLFLNHPLLGVVCALVTLWKPGLAFMGLISVIAAYGFARFIHIESLFLKSGFYTYNVLLVGLSMGSVFEVTLLSVTLTVLLSILTFMVVKGFKVVFSTYFYLPVLSLPFVIVSSVGYLAVSNYSNLLVTGLSPHFSSWWEHPFPSWIAGFFQSLGAIFSYLM